MNPRGHPIPEGRLLARLLRNLNTSLLLAVLLLLVVAYGFHGTIAGSPPFVDLALRYLHLLCGIMWMGFLLHFHFVQAPGALDPATARNVAGSSGETLFWARYAALFSIVTGVVVALPGGRLADALLLHSDARVPGLGMWLALAMAANLWLLVWPNQRKAQAAGAATPAGARAAAFTVLFSRLNLLMALPMLYCMLAARLAADA